MKNITCKLLLLAFLLGGAACSDDDDDGCVHCTAACEGDNSKTLNYCGGDTDQAEQEFRNANPGCVVECTYHNE